MAKAYLYKKVRNGKNYICATFKSSTELVTIYHDADGIFHQHVLQGEVDYSRAPSDIANSLSHEKYLVSSTEVGHVIDSVWRPGLTVDVPIALNTDDNTKHRAKKDLKILIEKLHEVLLFVEPDDYGLKSHGHKTRELLILSCTEVENAWKYYLRLGGNTTERPNTKDYVTLCDRLYLPEYRILFNSHPIQVELTPFVDWKSEQPSQSLPWYDAYNHTKHDKSEHFDKATLAHCLNSIAANIVMFCVRYSPYEIIRSIDICSNLINEYFSISLVDPDLSSFYVPMLKSVKMTSGAFSAPRGSAYDKKWEIDSFVL
jgi:hypothetical protein